MSIAETRRTQTAIWRSTCDRASSGADARRTSPSTPGSFSRVEQRLRSAPVARPHRLAQRPPPRRPLRRAARPSAAHHRAPRSPPRPTPAPSRLPRCAAARARISSPPRRPAGNDPFESKPTVAAARPHAPASSPTAPGLDRRLDASAAAHRHRESSEASRPAPRARDRTPSRQRQTVACRRRSARPTQASNQLVAIRQTTPPRSPHQHLSPAAPAKNGARRRRDAAPVEYSIAAGTTPDPSTASIAAAPRTLRTPRRPRTPRRRRHQPQPRGRDDPAASPRCRSAATAGPAAATSLRTGPAEGHQLARRDHRLDAGHPAPRHAVLEGVRPARVGREVAPSCDCSAAPGSGGNSSPLSRARRATVAVVTPASASIRQRSGSNERTRSSRSSAIATASPGPSARSRRCSPCARRPGSSRRRGRSTTRRPRRPPGAPRRDQHRHAPRQAAGVGQRDVALDVLGTHERREIGLHRCTVPSKRMPEGDTIHYAANRIRPVLEGQVPDAIATPHPRFGKDRWPERLHGREVEAVTAHGKHLFLRFAGDLTIHSHLRMTGAWRVHPDGARWPRAPRRAWLVITKRRPGRRAVRRPGARAADRDAPPLRPAPARAGPRHHRRGLRRGRRSCAACARTTRRAGSATRCWTSARSPGSATSGRPRAAGWPRSTRGAPTATVTDDEVLPDRPRAAAAHAAVRHATATRRATARSTSAPAAPARAAASGSLARGQGDDNRTTYWCPGCQS